jgi:hypothetical protein
MFVLDTTGITLSTNYGIQMSKRDYSYILGFKGVRTNLRNLIRKLSNFEGWTINQQIVCLGWFLHKVCDQENFTEEDLRRAFEDLDISPPASFGRDLIKSCPEIKEDKIINKLKPPNEIIPVRTYRLKWLAIDQLDQQYSPIFAATDSRVLKPTDDNKLLSEPPSNVSMRTCFVMQPFDRAKFDGRYKDIFKPAIEAAGFEPYRVDQDPSVSIPINRIEKAIREAAAGFADITNNNPNVLFELGYAIACGKELAIVRERKARQKKFPFDLQHRAIILYDTDTLSHYETLQGQITERLKAIGLKPGVC